MTKIEMERSICFITKDIIGWSLGLFEKSNLKNDADYCLQQWDTSMCIRLSLATIKGVIGVLYAILTAFLIQVSHSLIWH